VKLFPVPEVKDSAWAAWNTHIERFEKYPYNLDLAREREYIDSPDWRHDCYFVDLPKESAGVPEPNGAFALAQDVVRTYKFPPPGLIKGIYRETDPLDGRVMLLEGRFLGFTFYFGVRITGVTDEVLATEQGRSQLWGYSYATLKGHFEQGKISFHVSKNLDTGAVAFTIKSFSRTGRIDNLWYRIGFFIFGRFLQRRFATQSLKRLLALVMEGLAQRDKMQGMPPVPAKVIPAVPVQPVAVNPAAQDALEGLKRPTASKTP
jgi:hypothetical protein